MRVQVKGRFLAVSLLESATMKTPKKMSGKMGPSSKKTKMMATPKKKGMPGKGKAKTPMGGKSTNSSGGKKMGPPLMGK